MTDFANIAIFMDYENVKRNNHNNGRNDYPHKILDVILQELSNDDSIGKIGLIRVYLAQGLPGKNSPVSQEQIFKIFDRGAEPKLIPSFKSNNDDQGLKNITDGEMMCDILDTLYTNSSIDTFCLVTSDKDFIPVIRRIHSRGKKIILFHRGSTDYLLNQVTVFCNNKPEDKRWTRCFDLNTLLSKQGSKSEV